MQQEKIVCTDNSTEKIVCLEKNFIPHLQKNDGPSLTRHCATPFLKQLTHLKICLEWFCPCTNIQSNVALVFKEHSLDRTSKCGPGWKLSQFRPNKRRPLRRMSKYAPKVSSCRRYYLTNSTLFDSFVTFSNLFSNSSFLASVILCSDAFTQKEHNDTELKSLKLLISCIYITF